MHTYFVSKLLYIVMMGFVSSYQYKYYYNSLKETTFRENKSTIGLWLLEVKIGSKTDHTTPTRSFVNVLPTGGITDPDYLAGTHILRVHWLARYRPSTSPVRAGTKRYDMPGTSGMVLVLYYPSSQASINPELKPLHSKWYWAIIGP